MAEVNAIHPAEIADQAPTHRKCMDAPSTTYRVHQRDGRDLEIGAIRGCHTFALPHGEGQRIVRLLDTYAGE